MEWLLANEGALRLAVFAGVLTMMAGAEALFPRRPRVQLRSRRWSTTAAIIVLDTIALRVVVPVLAVGAALWAGEHGWGLLNWAGLPIWLEVAIAIVLLDMAIYWQHVITHHVPLLWRLHQVHHVDRDIDVMTGIRFHPIEIVLSMAYKLALVMILGPAAVAVLLFELVLNGAAMFNHANVRLPLGVDRVLRRLVVTPDMHRVHHSVIEGETNSNYGFFLSVWDRLFGTYTDQPREGHDDMTIGLAEHQHDGPGQLVWSMVLPFRRNRKT